MEAAEQTPAEKFDLHGTAIGMDIATALKEKIKELKDR